MAEPLNLQTRRTSSQVFLMAAPFVFPLALQTLLVLVAEDPSFAGIPIGLLFGAWVLAVRLGARGVAIAFYVVLVGILLFVYSLGLHIATHGL